MIKKIAKFTVGSSAFFSQIENFTPHDTDILYIIDKKDFTPSLIRLSNENKDIFLYSQKNKKDFINECLKQNDSIAAGKFLVPEFCKYIGATIVDICKLKPLFEKIDDKHKYESYIFKCYIDNNGIYLTNEQLKKAYIMYSESRNDN